MNEKIFLLSNLALGFYNVGTIWAHEVDIFRTWKLVDPKDFSRVQTVHWRKLPYWVFIPVGLGIVGSIVLIWYHPANSPLWGVSGAVASQVLSIVLTAVFWGRWKASLSRDPLGPKSPYLSKILSTHWARTALINLNAFVLLAWTIVIL